MAHTIQRYGDRVERFNDIDLLIIMSIVIDYINEHKDVYPSIMQTLQYWEERIAGYAPGFIQLDYDKELNEDAVRHAFLFILSEVRAKLASFGDSVPVEFLRCLAMFRLFGDGETIRFF
jgi:hypothetical protein